MTFAPQYKPQPGDKPIKVTLPEKFVLPIIRRPEPSAVDRLAAVVDARARRRVERAGTFPTLLNSQIASVLPMTRRRQHR